MVYFGGDRGSLSKNCLNQLVKKMAYELVTDEAGTEGLDLGGCIS